MATPVFCVSEISWKFLCFAFLAVVRFLPVRWCVPTDPSPQHDMIVHTVLLARLSLPNPAFALFRRPAESHSPQAAAAPPSPPPAVPAGAGRTLDMGSSPVRRGEGSHGGPMAIQEEAEGGRDGSRGGSSLLLEETVVRSRLVQN